MDLSLETYREIWKSSHTDLGVGVSGAVVHELVEEHMHLGMRGPEEGNGVLQPLHTHKLGSQRHQQVVESIGEIGEEFLRLLGVVLLQCGIQPVGGRAPTQIHPGHHCARLLAQLRAGALTSRTWWQSLPAHKCTTRGLAGWPSGDELLLQTLRKASANSSRRQHASRALGCEQAAASQPPPWRQG